MTNERSFEVDEEQIKIESDLFYRACDEIGILVIQDMPSPRPLQSTTDAACNSITVLPYGPAQQEFTRQLELMVNQFKSHPSIVTWVSCGASHAIEHV